MRQLIDKLNHRGSHLYFVANFLIASLFSIAFYILSPNVSATYVRSHDYSSIALVLGFALITFSVLDLFLRTKKSIVILLLISIYLSFSIGRILLYLMDRLLNYNFVFGDINYLGSIAIIGLAVTILLRNGFSVKEVILILIVVIGASFSDFMIGTMTTQMMINT